MKSHTHRLVALVAILIIAVLLLSASSGEDESESSPSTTSTTSTPAVVEDDGLSGQEVDQGITLMNETVAQAHFVAHVRYAEEQERLYVEYLEHLAAEQRAAEERERQERERQERAARERAERERQAAAQSAPQATPPANTGGSGVWDQLAQCESGGNWSINTGNGYYGGLQFSLQSWRGVGGSGYPHQASREEQISRGQALQRIQGWGAWPGCARQLGLR